MKSTTHRFKVMIGDSEVYSANNLPDAMERAEAVGKSLGEKPVVLKETLAQEEDRIIFKKYWKVVSSEKIC